MSKTVATLVPMLAGLARFFPPDITLVNSADFPSIAAMAEAHPDIAAVFTFGGSRLTAEMLAPLKAVKLVQCYGAGYDGIDVAGLKARGIVLANCPNTNNEDVADTAVGLFVALVRDIVAGHGRVVSGAWGRGERGGIRPSIRQLKAGIVGMGAIGQSIARRLPGFGMTDIAWWGPNAKPEIALPRSNSVLELARASDVVFMAGRADETSRGLFSAEVIEAIGPNGYLINVSRGFTVDEDALIAALKDGRIGGAGLDVFLEEPTPAARWAEVPNVVLSPHMAGGGKGAMEAMTKLSIENLTLFFAGQPVKTPVV